MTRKHFIALADMLRSEPWSVGLASHEHLDALADFCEAQNPRFKRERWLAYIRGECGPNGGKV